MDGTSIEIERTLAKETVSSRKSKVEFSIAPVRRSWSRHFLALAAEMAKMGTCSRRQVGCVLVDLQNVVLSTGFNGVPRGFPHCSEGTPCPGATAESGTMLDECLAVHAETNALAQCLDVERIHTIYCTTAPCISCTKQLLCTAAQRVVFMDDYPQAAAACALWTKFQLRVKTRDGVSFYKREWVKFDA